VTRKELDAEVHRLRMDCRNKEHLVKMKWAESNATVNIGDIITDGNIICKVENISYSEMCGLNIQYSGERLTKKRLPMRGSPKTAITYFDKITPLKVLKYAE
jgi:hypothetical protein